MDTNTLAEASSGVSSVLERTESDSVSPVTVTLSHLPAEGMPLGLPALRLRPGDAP